MTLLSKSTETATPELRWLDVGGMRPILQQQWVREVWAEQTAEEQRLQKLHLPSSRELFWRDVPTVQKKR